MKQDQAEARSNVEKRIEFIEAEMCVGPSLPPVPVAPC